MSDVSICNKALGEIGARVMIASLSENSPAARNCALQYNSLREQLLRTAPWGFARKTLALTTLGLLSDDPPGSPYPWLAKYLYPADCLKMRYILPSPVVPLSDVAPDVSSMLVPWCAPSRSFRYLPAYDDTVSPPRRVLLSNVISAIGVYTVSVTDTSLFDPLFENALVMSLASKLVMGLTGNVALKQSYAALAEAAIMQARATDGNEAIPTTDHTVDWIEGRGVASLYGNLGEGTELGQWWGGNDSMAWGM